MPGLTWTAELCDGSDAVEPHADPGVMVLKFGGSVLRAERDAGVAVHEIYRWIRNGWRVIAVVSAFEGETDALLARARAIAAGGPTDPTAGGIGCVSEAACVATAALVATGEQQSAAVLGLELDRAGLPCEVLDAASLGLRTEGPTLDSVPIELDCAALRSALDRVPVVVAPGFAGRDAHGRITLLGRGGSDLSALAIARHLPGSRCRLIKDVDGLYDRDPAAARGGGDGPRRYGTLSWLDGLRLDGTIVQHKALRYAEKHALEFEVGAALATGATRVGKLDATFDDSDGPEAIGSGGTDRRVPRGPRLRVPRRPLRVALLGAGTVGLGVHDALRRLPAWFEIAGVLVRDEAKAVRAGVMERLVTSDPDHALDLGADIVVEALGGIEPARDLIGAALELGSDVVTANKAVIAAWGSELSRTALERGRRLLWSAAVGGAVPCLEVAARLARRGQILSIEGVLNGTTNFVLGRIAEGEGLEAAVRQAQIAGLAEADPSRDLDGRDAADKLVLLCREAFGADLRTDDVVCDGLTADALEAVLSAGNGVPRQVARAWRTGDGTVRASVGLESVDATGTLGRLRGQENALVVRTEAGEIEIVSGKGAGRWPTAEAVVADLLVIARDRLRHSGASVAPIHALETCGDGVGCRHLESEGATCHAD